MSVIIICALMYLDKFSWDRAQIVKYCDNTQFQNWERGRRVRYYMYTLFCALTTLALIYTVKRNFF